VKRSEDVPSVVIFKTVWRVDHLVINIAMEKMALIEIDGLPINSMVDLSSSQTVNVITRGYTMRKIGNSL